MASEISFTRDRKRPAYEVTRLGLCLGRGGACTCVATCPSPSPAAAIATACAPLLGNACDIEHEIFAVLVEHAQPVVAKSVAQ